MNEAESKVPSIPNYDIIERLGSGGVAAVWLAQRHHTEHVCVIKVLHAKLAEDETSKARFLREAHVTALLNHPSIARLYDAGRLDAGMYIAMEYIPGCDLKQLASRWSEGRLSIELCGAIALGILEALDYAHNFVDSEGAHLQIVHRDLSPRNMMVNFEGRIKLIDFGLVTSRIGRKVTAPGTLSGTIKYMAPEQVRGGPIDGRTDLYSLAAVLYELLTGHPPYPGDRLDTVLNAVLTQEPKAPSTLNSAISPGLEAVLLKSLQKLPDDRYRSAQELRAALQDALAGLELPSADPIAEQVRALFPQEYERSLELQYPTGIEDTIPMSSSGPALAAELEPGSPALAQMNVPTVAEPLPKRGAIPVAETAKLPLESLPARGGSAPAQRSRPMLKRGLLIGAAIGGLLLLLGLLLMKGG